MTELKTLKDLSKNRGFNKEGSPSWLLDGVELKAEAVKCLSHGIEDLKRPEEISSRIIQNFIDFFEFDEEDLKDE